MQVSYCLDSRIKGKPGRSLSYFSPGLIWAYHIEFCNILEIAQTEITNVSLQFEYKLSGFPNYIDIAEAFEKEIQISGDDCRAANAAFVQWYKSEWRVNKYYKSSYAWYVDMLDESKIIQKYLKISKIPWKLFLQALYAAMQEELWMS